MGKTIFILIVMAVLPVSRSWGALITLDFEAVNFINFTELHGGEDPDIEAPDEVVSGTFQWEAESSNSTVGDFVSVSLTIDGFEYDINDLTREVFDEAKPLLEFVGVIGAGETVHEDMVSENDFAIVWRREDVSPISFTYQIGITQPDFSNFWRSNTFTRFSITEAPIPEPGSLVLLSLGILGLYYCCPTSVGRGYYRI